MRFKIRTQFLFCLLIGFLISLFTLFALEYAVDRVDHFRHLSLVSQQRLLVATSLRAQVRNNLLQAVEKILDPNPESLNRLRVTTSEASLQKLLRQLALPPDEELGLQQSLQALKGGIEQSVAFAMEGHPRKAYREFLRIKKSGFQDDFIPKMVQVIERQTVEMKASGEALRASTQALRQIVYFSSFLAVSLSLVLIAFLTRAMGRRIRSLEQAAFEVSQGNFDVHLDDRGRDEISVLSRAFNVMALRLCEARRGLAQHQQTLLNTAKLSALGEMAAGIAHEINTPLGALILNAEMVEKRLSAEAPDIPLVLQRVHKIISIGGRIGKIIDGLRLFSRDASNDQIESFPVIHLIESTLDLCCERFRVNGIELIVGPVSSDLIIQGRQVQLSQVLLNLLNNSFDAVHDLSKKWIRIETVVDGSHVDIRVWDNGPGVPEGLGDKIFQPFFTTKPVGKGTGLGLSLSQGLMRSHGGDLFYFRANDETCFVIRLPRQQGEGGK